MRFMSLTIANAKPLLKNMNWTFFFSVPQKIKKNKVLGIAFISIYLLLASAIMSQVKPRPSEREHQAQLLIELADSLSKEAQYDYALRLYLDYTELYPLEKDIYSAYEGIARINIIQQELPQAVDIYFILYNKTGPGEKGLSYLYQAAKLYDRMGMVEERNGVISEILATDAQTEAAEKARMLVRFDNALQPKLTTY